MHTKNDDKFGTLLTWNHKNTTNFYSDSCNTIKGGAGEFYPTDRTRDHITLYSSEMCSYTQLDYEGDVDIKGVQAYKYAPLHLFDNGNYSWPFFSRINFVSSVFLGHTVPETKCFCKDECIPSGVLDISACREDSPIFLSLPHFYGADPYYTNIIDGLKPEKDKHEFYITLEPVSCKIEFILFSTIRLQPTLKAISRDISNFSSMFNSKLVFW